MEAKTIEVRDAATFIPALAVKFSPTNLDDRYLLARAGYGTHQAEQEKYILFGRLDGHSSLMYSPNQWGGDTRTMPTVHLHLIDHWDEIESGDVIDVQFLLGETDEPKISEAIRSPV